MNQPIAVSTPPLSYSVTDRSEGVRYKTDRKKSSPIGIIRQYLTALNPAALDAEALHNELAMRAKIILEYMHQYSITDVNQGIRQFTAFERQRLYQLGILEGPKTPAAYAGA